MTDANGRFHIITIIPGRKSFNATEYEKKRFSFFFISLKDYYDNGYRPAHIHFNITADGYPKLITQLYFNRDYFLAPRDSCTHCEFNINQASK